MPATSTGPWYEVQGLYLCPANDHPNTHCSVPDEGEWLPIYFMDDEAMARRALVMVMESDDPMYERCEDFRLAVPSEKYMKAKRKAQQVKDDYRQGNVVSMGKRKRKSA